MNDEWLSLVIINFKRFYKFGLGVVSGMVSGLGTGLMLELWVGLILCIMA